LTTATIDRSTHTGCSETYDDRPISFLYLPDDEFFCYSCGAGHDYVHGQYADKYSLSPSCYPSVCESEFKDSDFTKCPDVGPTTTTTIADDPVISLENGDHLCVHGTNGSKYNLLSAETLSVNAQFVEVPSQINTPAISDNTVGRIGMLVCGVEGGFVVERNGLVHFQGQELQPGEHVIANGTSITVKTHQCDPKMNCGWTTQALPGNTLTEHRQVVLNHGKVIVTVNVNFLQSMDDVFPFLEVTMGGKYGKMHGLLGQGASGSASSVEQRAVEVGVFGKTVSEYQGGVQGEGMIEGVYTDYEVADLLSTDFAFTAFECKA